MPWLQERKYGATTLQKYKSSAELECSVSTSAGNDTAVSGTVMQNAMNIQSSNLHHMKHMFVYLSNIEQLRAPACCNKNGAASLRAAERMLDWPVH
jgi:hypothetical protein